MRIGYVRVSTREQNPDRQIAAMREFGLTDAEIVIEKQSGKDFYRPLYKRAGRCPCCQEHRPDGAELRGDP